MADDSGEKKKKHRAWRTLRFLTRWTIYGLALASLALTFTPAGDWASARLVKIDPLAKADYIVVLGGSSARAVEAANLHRQQWAPTVIISSGGKDADDLAEVARAYGVSRDALLVDRDARSTMDHTRTLLLLPGVRKEDRFLLVTSPFHTARVRACFQKAGFPHVIVRTTNWTLGGELAAGRTGWKERMSYLPYELYEAAAWGYYRLVYGL